MPIYTNRSIIGGMDIRTALEGYFATYDLNEDDIVTWREYHTVNQFYKKKVKGETKTFQYIDKNQDWRVTHKEFVTAKFYKFVMASQNGTTESLVLNTTLNGGQ